jgi:hypothetical protein
MLRKKDTTMSAKREFPAEEERGHFIGLDAEKRWNAARCSCPPVSVSEDSLAKVQFNPTVQKFQEKTSPIIIDHSR